MRPAALVLPAFALVAFAVALGSSCRSSGPDAGGGQTVFPCGNGAHVARRYKPNVMLVVDKSGSMLISDDGGSSTRLDEMKTAMGDFLTTNGTIGRFGLSVFPNATDLSTQCNEGVVLHQVVSSYDVEAELQAQAEQINNTVQAIGSGGLDVRGGSPTAATLRTLASNASLRSLDRENVVILITDGLPNCNSTLDGNNCTCTSGTATCGGATCLDDVASVAAINDLRTKEIRTVVIGLGNDVAAILGRDALNAMARAGGLARTCAAGCGGDPCDEATGFCDPSFHLAGDAAKLSEALTEWVTALPKHKPCVYTFEGKAISADFVVVYVDGQRVEASPDTWTFSYADGLSSVTFSGDICGRLESASFPPRIEIRGICEF